MSTRSSQEVHAQLHAERFKIARSYLQGMERRSELVPGSAAIILDRLKARSGSPTELLRLAAEFVEGSTHPVTGAHEPGAGVAFLDPHHKAEDLPIRLVTARLVAGNYMGASFADSFFRQHAAEVAGRTLGEVAESVAERLDAAPAALVDPPAPPGNANKVFKTLLAMQDAIDPAVDLRRVAEDWKLWGLEPQEKLARMCRDAILGRSDLRVEGAVIDERDPVFQSDAAEQKVIEATAAGMRSGYDRSLG